ncbi:MAG: hypothetical protein WCH75_21065, partial [Candidatus Binatia bacterium]
MILGMHRKKPFHYRSPGNTVKQACYRPSDLKANLNVLNGLFSFLLGVMLIAVSGCATVDETSKKNPQLGLITTPTTYYTTQKARYLGEKYKQNLDRLVERIVRNPKTANLQFANNIASAGGIGFFTHSATAYVDERFLEVVMGLPETLDAKSDNNTKVARVFSLYGAELLSILASEQDIYQEKEMSGYGLNLSWRNIAPEPNGTRITLERAVLYFSKARVRNFLAGNLTQNALLGEAVMFAVTGEGPMRLVSFRPQELKPDSRLPIQEETIAAAEKGSLKSGSKSDDRSAISSAVNPSPSSQRPEAIPTESAPSTDRSFELTVSPPFRENPKDSGKVRAELARQTEVPLLSSSSANESAQPQEARVNQTPETAFRKQEPAEPSDQSAALQQQKAEILQPIVSNGSFVSAQTPAIEFSVNRDEPLENQTTTAKLPESQLVTLPSSQALQGFIVQVAFTSRHEAQHWARILERRGYTVSITEAGGAESIR